MHRVNRTFHLTGVVADLDAAVAPLRNVFGAVVLHTDSGETFGTRMDRAMLWVGDQLLELIQPIGGPSPVAEYLERFGGGMNGLGLEVADGDATEAHLAGLGVEVAVRYADDMFATRTRRTAGLALQWARRCVPDDPRDAAAPEPDGSPMLHVGRLAFVAAVVADPARAAAELAAVIGTAATDLDDHAGPAAAVGLGDCTLALFPLDSAAFGGHDRPRFVAIALEVDDFDQAAADLAAHDVSVREAVGPGALVDVPAPIAVMLWPGLLPGDPRLD